MTRSNLIFHTVWWGTLFLWCAIPHWDGSDARYRWAQSLDTASSDADGDSALGFGASGLLNQNFIVAPAAEGFVTDKAECDAVLDEFTADAGIVNDLLARGFHSISCYRDGSITRMLRRVAPAPHNVPRRHDRRPTTVLAESPIYNSAPRAEA